MNRTQNKRSFFFVLLACAGSIILLSAVTPVNRNYNLSGNHSFVINGTSNLHDWSEIIETASGNASGTMNNDKSFNLDEVNIKMDVYSIKSTRGNIMDNNTYKALKADKHPYIIYTLKQSVKAIKPGAEKKIVFARGRLTIAGVTKEVNMIITLTMQDSGKFEFEGSQALQMTDYGIVPPTALLGSLKTGNKIIITFRSEFIATIRK